MDLSALLRALGFVVTALVMSEAILHAEDPAPQIIDFNRDIRAILSNNCFQCHGPDENERQADLRLDTEAGAFADLGGRAAVVPRKPEESELIRRVTTRDEAELMPPADSGKKLSPGDIELLTEWVRQGAPFARHWSYVKPQRSPLPAVHQQAWVRNAVDQFILARLEREQLEPSQEADRHALVRRVTLDLTGLPPTWEEALQFVNDASPDAYERLVDRLLASPAFGEHWARMWLDLARYADSAGYADDPPRTIWAYRDYVINSFNANKPFDQFTLEQIAGDLLPQPTEEHLIATAFHRNTLTNNEGGTNDEEFRNVAIVDRVNTTMAVWMGATMACAQCHSHKYDPITQEEYFRFFAFFNNTQDADQRDESPLLHIFTEEQQRQMEQWRIEIKELENITHTLTPALAEAQTRWENAMATPLAWTMLHPAEVKTQSGVKGARSEHGAVFIPTVDKTDSITLNIPLEKQKLSALRLEALPHEALPGGGPGHAGGNFVLTDVRVSLTPASGGQPAGRYVRIELPGMQKILSLAEVQVFHGEENLGRQGKATQSSVAFDGPAVLAIDGNTNGQYFEGKSTTHTAVSDDPWWEVDLGGEQAIDRIVVWNRTDNNLESRLSNFRIIVLNNARETVWEQNVKQPPDPSTELSLSGAKTLTLAAAYADFEQSGFPAASVISNKEPSSQGWAIGSAVGKPHELTLLLDKPYDVEHGDVLSVQLAFASPHENHVLGHFRISVTNDTRAIEVAKLPPAIVAIQRTNPESRTEAQRMELSKYFLSVASELQPERTRRDALKKQLAEIKPATTVPIMRELSTTERRKTQIQFRGNFMDLGNEVYPGVPAAFPPLAEGATPDRLAVARWLVDPENPLTARVIVNRYWEQLFGMGLVRTSEEFGSQGEAPSHPELLDWLATEFQGASWDTKALLRLLVTSATYRQSSRVTPELLERDPDNRLLARGPRFRLSAEMVRDQALATAGLLSRKMHGPSVQPPRPVLGLSAAFGGSTDWKTSAGDDRFRRGLYTEWRRSLPYPSMDAFDAPSREVCTLNRSRTNTPLQALVTMNDPVYIEAAQAFARRILEANDSTPDRASYAFRLCLTREPSSAELDRLIKLYEDVYAQYAQMPEQASKMATVPLGPAPADADVAQLAAWTVLGNVLLNLDEALMKR